MIKEEDGSKTIYIIMPFYKVKKEMKSIKGLSTKFAHAPYNIERKYPRFN